jgi:hypothetical protein
MARRFESHVTVLYEVPDIAALRRTAGATRPLRLRAEASARWAAPDHGIHVAVTDPHGDLARFRAAIGADNAGYAPHITLLHRESVATAEQADVAWEELRAFAPRAEFEVEDLVVYEEEGVWRDAGRVPFAR